jgi:predicted metalloprotease with PDZ domain
MSCRLLVAWLLVALLGVLPAFARDDPARWAARYEVRFGASATGVPHARVQATLRWLGKRDQKPSSVDVGMAEDGFPNGYGAFVRDFEASVPAGSRRPRGYPALTLSAPNGRYRLGVPRSGVVGFSYLVVLEHDPAGWGPGPDEAPYLFEDGVFWTGRAVFVTAPECRAEVTFAAPDGDRVLTSFEPVAAARRNTFSVPDEQRLRDSFLVVGRPAAIDLQIGAASVTLALGGPLKPSLPILSKAMARFLDASAALFGGAPPRRILVVGNIRGPKGSFNGGTYGSDVSFLVDEPLGSGNAGRWGPFLCHELFHLWNGYALDYQGQQYWMSEGFTDYYARVLLVRQGDLSSDDFLADLRQRMAGYVWRDADIGLHEAGDAKFKNTALVYEGGSLAALCLDLQVRAATSNRKSLDDVMKALYKEFGGNPGRKVTATDVITLTSNIAERPFADFFGRYVNGHEALPLAESMKLAGIRVTPRFRMPKGRWIAVGLLRSPLTAALPGGGVEILESAGEPLREGDLISEVAGAGVKRFEDLRMAFRDVTPGATVTVIVTRHGERTPVEVTLGGDSSSPRSGIWSVSAEVLSTLDPLTLAIRKSVFGSELTSVATAQ